MAMFGRGTPRGLQGRAFDTQSLEIAFAMLSERLWMTPNALLAFLRLVLRPPHRYAASALE
jgi:hypothetical protein